MPGHLLVYYNLFQRLKGFRHWIDGVPQPITCADIERYANRYGFDKTVDDLEKFEYLIRACDEAEMGYYAEKRSHQMKALQKKVK